MIPVLFTSTATEFTTQGLGALTDAISCTVTEERNGIFELEMQYPVTGIHYADIQYRAIIVAIPSPYRSKQPFRVYKITRPLDGVVTIYAAHLSYDLNAIPVKPFSATGIVNAFAALKENMLISNSFTFQAGITNPTSRISYQTPNAARSVLGGIQGSFLDIFGGEYEWDVWTIRLWANRGADNGVNIRYGKNMTALNAETDGENTVTGIYPYWYKDDVLVDADIVWVENAPYQKALPVDFTNDFEEQPTEAQLTERAEQYINDNDVGTVPVSIDVSFIQLAQMSGYENIAALEKCDLCDTVTVQYEALGVDIKSKIVKIVTDVLRERYESMQVGTIRADVAQTIANTENKVDAVVRPDGSLVAEALRGFINGSLVNLYAQYDAAEPAGAVAILFENNDPSSNWYGALAIGTQGLMISREKKSDGTGWSWTLAITAEGINAALAVLGILSDKAGKNYWNMETGEAAFSGDVTFAGKLIAASGTFDGLVTVNASGSSGLEVYDPMGNKVMSIGTKGMDITPFANLWGITVSETLKILGGTYGEILSYDTTSDTSVLIYQNSIVLQKGDSTSVTLKNYVSIDITNNGGRIAISNPDNLLDVYCSMSQSGFYTSGTKARKIKTENYGDRFQYCYEMPSPVFGDIGCGQLDETGVCVVPIDEIFSETINTRMEYQVFLQKEGEGDVWVREKQQYYFVVNGTPKLKFAWEIKARQKDFEMLRMEENLDTEDDTYMAYDAMAEKFVQEETEAQENLIFDAEKYYKDLEEITS